MPDSVQAIHAQCQTRPKHVAGPVEREQPRPPPRSQRRWRASSKAGAHGGNHFRPDENRLGLGADLLHWTSLVGGGRLGWVGSRCRGTRRIRGHMRRRASLIGASALAAAHWIAACGSEDRSVDIIGDDDAGNDSGTGGSSATGGTGGTGASGGAGAAGGSGGTAGTGGSAGQSGGGGAAGGGGFAGAGASGGTAGVGGSAGGGNADSGTGATGGVPDSGPDAAGGTGGMADSGADACHADMGNSCGSCGGSVLCNGSCSVPTPANWNQSCGSCGGKINCQNQCSIPTPGTYGNPCNCGGTITCSGSCSQNVPPEICDGQDNNCSGTADETFTCKQNSPLGNANVCGVDCAQTCNSSCSGPNPTCTLAQTQWTFKAGPAFLHGSGCGGACYTDLWCNFGTVANCYAAYGLNAGFPPGTYNVQWLLSGSSTSGSYTLDVYSNGSAQVVAGPITVSTPTTAGYLPSGAGLSFTVPGCSAGQTYQFRAYWNGGTTSATFQELRVTRTNAQCTGCTP